MLEIGIGPHTEIALLDTGAQMSAIAKKKLDAIKSTVEIPQLPMPKLNIRGAFGERSRIRQQVMLPLRIQNVILPCSCMGGRKANLGNNSRNRLS